MIESRVKGRSTRKSTRFVVCTDTFMSGWGKALGRSLYALRVGPASAQIVLANAKRRREMKRCRIVKAKANGRPDVKLRAGDHLAIVGRDTAQRWYTPGGFGT